jgi:hypothetical protein
MAPGKKRVVPTDLENAGLQKTDRDDSRRSSSFTSNCHRRKTHRRQSRFSSAPANGDTTKQINATVAMAKLILLGELRRRRLSTVQMIWIINARAGSHAVPK